MENNIEHAEKAMHYCSQIKKAINGLCHFLDLGDDPFDEMSRLETYKSMFRSAEKWEKQYSDYIEGQNESPVMEQTM